MVNSANFSDGQKASVKLQETIIELLKSGMDPKSIGLMSCSIGSAMLVDHYGKADGKFICDELANKAVSGELATYPALKAANQNNG